MPVPDFKESICSVCRKRFKLRIVERHSETGATYEGQCPCCGRTQKVHIIDFGGDAAPPSGQSAWHAILEGVAETYARYEPPKVYTPITCPRCQLAGVIKTQERGITVALPCPRCGTYYEVTIPPGA